MDIRGLTLHRPWPYAIMHLGKDIENRTWKPSGRFLGNYLAIHAGKQWDYQAVQFIYKITGQLLTPEICTPAGHIAGVVKLTGFETEHESPWFMGPVGWLLDDITPIKPGIAIVGRQGLWQLPLNVRRMVRAAWAEAQQPRI